MDNETYFRKLSRAVRWRLPWQEADEVLQDYQEIINESTNSSVDIQNRIGNPAATAKQLTNLRQYGSWLAVFGGMTFCLLLPELFLLRGRFHQSPALMYILLLSGLAASIVWFHHGESRKTPLPRRLLPMLLSLVAVTVAVAAILICLSRKVCESIPFSEYGTIARWALWLTGTIAAALGLFGLVEARLTDRRWRSLYVAGLTVLAECVLVFALITSMSLDRAFVNWWVPYVTNLGIVGVIGLIGTGVSLC